MTTTSTIAAATIATQENYIGSDSIDDNKDKMYNKNNNNTIYTLKIMEVISSVKAGATFAPHGQSLPSTLRPLLVMMIMLMMKMMIMMMMKMMIMMMTMMMIMTTMMIVMMISNQL